MLPNTCNSKMETLDTFLKEEENGQIKFDLKQNSIRESYIE